MEANKIRVASFFSGIGGFDLGFEQAGMEVVFQCEIEKFAQKVLKKHWPGVILHEDIKTLKATDIPSSELWCSGWPCQDLSCANTEREGLSGQRSGLFHVFAELAAEACPKWVVMENVPGLISADEGTALETVVDRLEEIGYMGGWFTSNLSDAGLPQNRDRVFFVASYRSFRAYHFFVDGSELSGDFAKRSKGWKGVGRELQEVSGGEYPLVVQRRGGFGYTSAKSICPAIRAQTGGHQGGHSDRPILCGEKLDLERVRETNGVSSRLDGRRGRLIGNSVSPIITKWIGQKIVAIEAMYMELDKKESANNLLTEVK